MKIDITAREIELMLMLLSDVASDDTSDKPSSFYSIEEIALMEKFEAALRKSDLIEPELLDTGSPSGLVH